MANFTNFEAESREHALAVQISELFPPEAMLSLGRVYGHPAITIDWQAERTATVDLRWRLHVIFGDPWAIEKLTETEIAEARRKSVAERVATYLEQLKGRKSSGQSMGTQFELHIVRPTTP